MASYEHINSSFVLKSRKKKVFDLPEIKKYIFIQYGARVF